MELCHAAYADVYHAWLVLLLGIFKNSHYTGYDALVVETVFSQSAQHKVCLGCYALLVDGSAVKPLHDAAGSRSRYVPSALRKAA